MHLHCYASSTFGRLAGLLTGIPTIIHDYDTEVYFPYPSYLKLADWFLAPTTAGAIAASPMVKRFLLDKRKIDEDKIKMMFHAIAPSKFQDVERERRTELRNRLGLNSATKVVGTVTKLGPQRGNELLIEAFSKVADRSDSALIIIYKLTRFHRLPNKNYVEVAQVDLDNAVNKLYQLAADLGISSKVHLIEWSDDVEDWSGIIDIFIAPFLSERFSSVHLLEAMAKGQPVIASDLGEQQQIIQDGKNGYLISPGDIDTLSKKTLELIQSGSLTAFSQQAKQTALNYSVSACVHNLQNTYAELAGKSITKEG